MKIIEDDKEEKLYQCEECLLFYKDKDWASKCKKWCRENKSCNLNIIKHAHKEI